MGKKKVKQRPLVRVTDTEYELKYCETGENTYDIEKDRVRNPLQLLEWVRHIIEKGEKVISAETILEFMIAVGNENGFDPYTANSDYKIERRK